MSVIIISLVEDQTLSNQADTYLIKIVVSYTEEKDRCQERLWPGNLVLAGWRGGV